MLANLKLTKKKKKKKKKTEESKTLENDDGINPMFAATKDEYSYKILLDRMYELLNQNNPDLINKKRATLRPPEILRVGTSKILWSNFPEICKMMNRDNDHVFKFFLAELGTTGSIDQKGRFMIKGKYVAKTIESLLKKYISEYIKCPMCKGVQTKLVKDNTSRMYFLHCSSCGASKSVASVRTGYHATGRGERKAARFAA